MKESSKAYIAVIVYTFIIGLSFMFVKMTLTVANPLDTLAHRFTIAWIGACMLVLFNKDKWKLEQKDFLKILPLAMLYPVLYFTLQIFGLVRTSSSEAGIIQATAPIFTLMLARIVLKEKVTGLQLFFIGLSMLGVIYIFFMNGAGAEWAQLVGSGFIILTVVTSALYNVFARRLTRKYSSLALTYGMTLFGFLVFNAMAIGNHVMNGTTSQFFRPFTHMSFVLAIVYLGILSSLGTSYLTNYALSKIEASQMSVFSNFTTLITILAGVIFLQEAFHYYHFIGAVIVIIGVVGTNYLGKGHRQAAIPKIQRNSNNTHTMNR